MSDFPRDIDAIAPTRSGSGWLSFQIAGKVLLTIVALVCVLFLALWIVSWPESQHRFSALLAANKAVGMKTSEVTNLYGDDLGPQSGWKHSYYLSWTGYEHIYLVAYSEAGTITDADFIALPSEN